MKLIEKIYSDAFEEGFDYAIQKLFGLHGRRVYDAWLDGGKNIDIVQRRKNFKEAADRYSKDLDKIREKAKRIRKEYGIDRYHPMDGAIREAEYNMERRAYQPVKDLYDKPFRRYTNNNTPERTLNTYINDKVSKKGLKGMGEVIWNPLPDVENYIKKKGVVSDMAKKAKIVEERRIANEVK
jgi:hypothetical protein